MQKGNVYLIPCQLADESRYESSKDVIQAIQNCRFFMVEELRSARRFISSLKLGIVIDELTFFQVNKDTPYNEIEQFGKKIPIHENIGVISEAGCPGIADPGALVVRWAHKTERQVVPLVGPSSLLLALMASGFNGQNFTFHGYLPIDKDQRLKKIKQLESDSLKNNCSQIFIETPYRNDKLLEDILVSAHEDTELCVAADITGNSESIISQKIGMWKKNPRFPGKVPAVFILYRR